MMIDLIQPLLTEISNELALNLPDGSPSAPGGLSDSFGTLMGNAKWMLLVLGMGGLLACGAMMILGRRNNSRIAADGAVGVPWVLAGISVAMLAPALVGAMAGIF